MLISDASFEPRRRSPLEGVVPRGEVGKVAGEEKLLHVLLPAPPFVGRIAPVTCSPSGEELYRYSFVPLQQSESPICGVV